MRRRTYTNVLIANGTSLSGPVDLGEQKLIGIAMPAAWTAAGLSFQGSNDNVTYTDLVDAAGAVLARTVGASQFSLVSGLDLPRYIKVRSGTLAVPVNQGADRTLQLTLEQES